MIEGYSMMYFGPAAWEGLWRNRHQLTSRFAQHNRVLYVEPPPYLRPAVRRLLRPRAVWQALRQPRLSREGALHVYHSPDYAPVSGRPGLNAATGAVRRALLQHSMRCLGIERPIIWLSQPGMVDLLGQFGERLSIYHVVDEYTAYHGVTQPAALRMRCDEQQLMTRVDMVIVVSPALLEAKRPYNPHTYLVPNGVDFAAYQQPPGLPHAAPADLAPIPEPRLVYAGLIGVRLDLALLVALARRRPEWSLVLIGQVDERGCQDELAQLRALPNAHFLGLKPAADVPAYLLACQACLLPYRRSEEGRHIDPLKLYDGLAAGKPIVATPIPAALPYAALVALAAGADAFERAVQEALADGNDGQAARRRAVAAANTWDRRVEQISALIETRLGETSRQPGEPDERSSDP